MPDSSSSSSPLSSSAISPKKRKPKGNKGLNMVLILAVIVVAGLFIWAEQQRRSTTVELEDTARQLEEIKAASQDSNNELALEILRQVGELIEIPVDSRPTVAKISDINRLKGSNEFFSAAKNGDYLILTGSRALLYDPDRHIILDVAPFVINTGVLSSPAADDSSQSQSQQTTGSADNTSDISETGDEG